MGSAGDIAQGSQLYGQENPLAFIQEMTTQFCSTRPHFFLRELSLIALTSQR